MNELECEIEVARIRAEAKATIEEVRDIAQTAIDRLTAVLQMTATEHEMLIQVVRAAGDAQTIRDVDNLLKALPSRFASLKTESTNLH